MTKQHDQNPYTSKITVVEGCSCPSHVRWFNCYCRDAMSYVYPVLPLSAEDDPDGPPSPYALADLIEQHPGAQFVYLDSKVYGKDYWGLTIMECAKQILANRKAKEVVSC